MHILPLARRALPSRSRYPEVVIDVLPVHEWGRDHRTLQHCSEGHCSVAVLDAQGKKFSKYKEGYIRKSMAIPAISSTTSAFGCDLLHLFSPLWLGDGNA